MHDTEFRVSEHVRIKEDENELLVQTREEVGRGKRFGNEGEVVLTPAEAERMARWILARNLEG